MLFYVAPLEIRFREELLRDSSKITSSPTSLRCLKVHWANQIQETTLWISLPIGINRGFGLKIPGQHPANLSKGGTSLECRIRGLQLLE